MNSAALGAIGLVLLVMVPVLILLTLGARVGRKRTSKTSGNWTQALNLDFQGFANAINKIRPK